MSEQTVTPLFPEILVDWSDINGNAMVLVGSVSRAMTRAHVPTEEIKKFMAEAVAGDYNHLIQTCMKWVTIVSKKESNA